MERIVIEVGIEEVKSPRMVLHERIGQGYAADGRLIEIFFEFVGEGGLRVDMEGRSYLVPYVALMEAVDMKDRELKGGE